MSRDNMPELPNIIFTRALICGNRKSLSSVRPESPLIDGYKSPNMQYTKFTNTEKAVELLEALRIDKYNDVKLESGVSCRFLNKHHSLLDHKIDQAIKIVRGGL